MTSTRQFLSQSYKNMVNRFGDKRSKTKENRNMPSFVKILIDLQEFIDNNRNKNTDADDPRAREIESELESTEKMVKEFLDEKIKNDYTVLPEFAFQLRCQDTDTDLYTDKFLSDIKPAFLFDIIKSNKWTKHQRNMVAKNGPFILTAGADRNIFQYEETDQRRRYVRPFMKKNLHTNKKYTTDVMIYLTENGF